MPPQKEASAPKNYGFGRYIMDAGRSAGKRSAAANVIAAALIISASVFVLSDGLGVRSGIERWLKAPQNPPAGEVNPPSDNNTTQPALYNMSGAYNISDDAYGNEYDVRPVVYNGKLYAVWCAYEKSQDINRGASVLLRAFDNSSWGPLLNVTAGQNRSYNGLPQAAVFGGKLYIFWSTADRNVTQNNDMDVVVKAYDGNTLGNLSVIGFPYRVLEMIPQAATFNDRLYAVWGAVGLGANSTTKATNIVEEFNGSAWTNITELVPSFGEYIGINPPAASLAAYHGALYAARVYSDARNRSSILVQSYDGVSWSAPLAMEGIRNPARNSFNVFPSLVVYDGKLYCFWMSNDTTLSDGPDYDIVYRSFDGANWSAAEEITQKADGFAADSVPRAAVFDGGLFVAWTTNITNYSQGPNDLDVVYRSFDGANWSAITLINPENDGGSSSDKMPAMAEYGGRLYVFWETTNTALTGGADADIVYRCIYRNDG